jgi:hypothetical protein
MNELAQGWEARLRNDLTGFADRGEGPRVEWEGSTLSAEWVARGKAHAEIFGVNPEGMLRWLTGGDSDASYSEFLRSDEMADFDQLAHAMRRAFPRFAPFVPSDAEVDAGIAGRTSELARPDDVAGLIEKGRSQAEGRTNLFFVKGDPGAGKTTLLRETTAFQAERYETGEADFLFFYVSAQGRELSNLRDAFSGELQDLRAGFTRDAIAALARNGLLIPVVDGFDELLGTAGYSGAFSSLQNLLTELQGLGALVVSARSAFYDLEFLGRNSSPANDADISITTIGLKPWTDKQLRTYLDQQVGGTASGALEKLDEADSALLKRPFFASQFLEFLSVDSGRDDQSGLLEFLINSYIEREAAKIVDSHGDPVLPDDGHKLLFEMTASQMWEDESRQLSLDDLRTLTEMVAEQFDLESDEALQLATKVTSYAGFRPGYQGARDEFSFEHEVYFDYFLAQAVSRFLREQRRADLERFMDRAVVPETVVADVFRSLGPEDRLHELFLQCPGGVRYDNRRRNFGAFLSRHASVHGVADTEVRGLAFVDIGFGPARFDRVRFLECSFVGVDLTEAHFSDCDALETRFDSIAVSDVSHLDLGGLKPGQNVGAVRHDTKGDLFAPDAVLAALRSLGLKAEESSQPLVYSDHAKSLIALLDQAARAYRRTNILYENDDYLQSLFQDPDWPELKRLLVDHGVVTTEVRSASGPRVQALRLRVPIDQLLTGQSAEKPKLKSLVHLWKALRAS